MWRKKNDNGDKIYMKMKIKKMSRKNKGKNRK